MEISETDEAMVALFTLFVGTKVVENPESRAGIDKALTMLKDHLLSNGKGKAAFLVKIVRTRSTDGGADPSLINLLRMDKGGSA